MRRAPVVLAAVSITFASITACSGGGAGTRVVETPAPTPAAAVTPPPTVLGAGVTTTAAAASPPATPVTLLAVGDAGSADADERAVAEAMTAYAMSHPVAAVVALGDNVYPDGSPSRFGAALDAPFAELRARAPLWAALGNHDVESGHGAAQLAHLGLPPLPFAQKVPGAVVYLLDANHPDAAQAQWLDDELSQPGPAVRIVAFHQPPYSCGPHGNDAAVVRLWVPVLERHRVRLVLSGHDHVYERFTSPGGVTYVVSGGGGAGLYELGRCRSTPPPDAARSAHHFVVLEVHGDAVHLRALTPEGTVLDDAVLGPGP